MEQPLASLSSFVGYFRRSRAEVSAGSFKLLFAMLVIAAAFSLTYADAKSLFTGTELRGILALGAFVSSVQLVGALVILRSKTAANAVLALVTLGGVFTAYIVHTELFYSENRPALVAVCGAALFALFVAFRVMDEMRWGGIALSAAALMGMGVVGLSLASDTFWQSARSGYRMGTRVVAPTPMSVEQANIRSITFEETPNVYFVGFDSIIPRSIMEEYMGIETTEYHEVVDAEARRFRNFFTNGVSTRNSFNILMALHEEVFQAYLESFRGDLRFFAGHQSSPLVRIMRENGYETTSVYQDTYFGYPKGSYMDNYMVQLVEMGICPRLDIDVKRLGFWRYCRLSYPHRERCPRIDNSVWRWGAWGYCKVFGFVAQPLSMPAGDYLVEQLTGLASDRPQFVIAHLWMPGHTPTGFNHEDRGQVARFKESYLRGSNRAAIYLRQMIDHVRDTDPNAILFVFGDHGALQSWGLEFEDDPTFLVQDQFAVLGGVYPRDRCTEYFDEAESRGYMTTLDAVHAILACLSGGQSALLEPEEHRLRVSTAQGVQWMSPEEFLYE